MEKLIRPAEVAKRLALSKSTIYRWFWEGHYLKGLKMAGGSIRIMASSIKELMIADTELDPERVEELFVKWGWSRVTGSP